MNANGKATELKELGGFVVSGIQSNRCKSLIRVHRPVAESDIGAAAGTIALENLRNSGGEGLGLLRGRFHACPQAAADAGTISLENLQNSGGDGPALQRGRFDVRLRFGTVDSRTIH